MKLVLAVIVSFLLGILAAILYVIRWLIKGGTYGA
jgi:hypothetical protein